MPYWVTPKHIDSKEAKEQIALFEQMMLTQEGNLVDVSNKNKFSYHLQIKKISVPRHIPLKI